MTCPRAGGRGRAAEFAVTLACAALLTPVSGSAQLPYREPLPWSTFAIAGQRRVLSVDGERFADGRSGWVAQRFGLTGVLPRGGKICLFLRIPYYSLDTAEHPVIARWPELTAPGQEDWPGEARSVGWGSPEFGWLGSLHLPLLGGAQYGFAAALPLGRDVLYPFASTSMPMRLQVRRRVSLGEARELALLVGGVVTFDSGRNRLDAAAYPSGGSAAAEFGWRYGQRRTVAVGGAAEWGGGARSLVIGLNWRVPASEAQSLVVGVWRELAGTAERSFATRISVAWTFLGTSPPGSPVAK